MAKVTVHRFTIYDITIDEPRTSRRWATQEAIDRLGGTVVPDTATEVDASAIGQEIDGLSATDFDPHAFKTPRLG